MAKQTNLERVLELLINEDTEGASELLHQVIVDKARTIYEEIAEEEEEETEEVREEEEMDEEEEEDTLKEGEDDAFGGSPDKDFSDEISADKDEVEADELNDGEADDEEDFEADFGGDEEGAEGGVEGRVEDLETQLLALRAEFDRLMMDELQEPYHDELAGEMGADADMGDEFGPGTGDEFGTDQFEMENFMEETQFLKAVKDTGQKQEGKLAGTGKNTPKGAVNAKSPFHKEPTKPVNVTHAVDFSKGKGDQYGKYHGDSAKDETISDNVGEKLKGVGHTDQKGDDHLVGTGKHTPKGATNTKPVLKPVKK